MAGSATDSVILGPGSLWLTRTDVDTGTPFNIGYINEFSIDTSFETKELYGQKEFPLVVARTTGKITGKMKPALVSGRAMNSVLYAGTVTDGKVYHTTSSSVTVDDSAYTATVTPSSGTFDTDLGVSIDGVALTKVDSDPDENEYAVSVSSSTATYTFNSAMAGESVDIAYAWYETDGDGQSFVIENQDIGTTPTFQIDYMTEYNGATFYFRFFKATGTKGSNSFKINDFSMPEYDFSIMSNSSNQIGIASQPTTL